MHFEMFMESNHRRKPVTTLSLRCVPLSCLNTWAVSVQRNVYSACGLVRPELRVAVAHQ